uniref:Uncharacterized protein n=1 Tax=Mola mola TaxID=94237 RepID=A0A3Q3W7K4_MOLML
MELYWYIVVIIFIIIKIFFYVCWYRSRQRQLAAYLSNPRNAQIVIVGGRAYLHQMCERQSQTSVWPNWYGAQDDLSIEEPSASYSHLDMPPPYEAVSGGNAHTQSTLPELCGGDSISVNEAPPPYTPFSPAPVGEQAGAVSHSEPQSESRSA